MESTNSEKSFDDSTVYELGRSVSLCTLCEFETKYLYSDTPTYGLSLPLIGLSSTGNEFSSLHLTSELPSAYDHRATEVNVPRYDNVAVKEQFPIYKSTQDAALKHSKKSSDINIHDTSSSFLEFVHKTAKQVPDGLSKTLWDEVSWDRSDHKRASENSRGKTVLSTQKNFTVPVVTIDGISSLISDLDDFLNEDKDKSAVERLGETRTRELLPRRNFVSAIRDDTPRKRLKISATARSLIDTPNATQFTKRFMNCDNSAYRESSKNFANNFRISSAILSRERQSENSLLHYSTESSLNEDTLSEKSTENDKLLSSKMTPKGQKVDAAMPNCTQFFIDEELCEKSKNVEMHLSTKTPADKQSNAVEETLCYRNKKMAARLPIVQFSLTYGEREKIDSQGRKNDGDIFEDDDNIPQKKLKIRKSGKKFIKRSDVENFQKAVAEEHPDKKLTIFATELSSDLGKEPEIPKLQEIGHGFVENKEICERNPRSSMRSLQEFEEEMDTSKLEINCATPSAKAMVEETLDAIATIIAVSPLKIPLESQDQNNHAESEDSRNKLEEESSKKNLLTNEVTEANVPTNEVTKTNVPTNEVTKTDVPTNDVTKTIVPTNQDGDVEKVCKKMAEAENELSDRNERNRESLCREKPSMMEINCDPVIKSTEEKFDEQLGNKENCIAPAVSGFPKGASRKNQNRPHTLKPEVKEKLTKSWKDVKKDFASTTDKQPRYQPLVVPRTPPMLNLEIFKARAAKRKGVLADAINRLSSLNSYMGEVRNIFRNDIKQYTIVKPTRSLNGRMKILVSTGTQTSNGRQDPVDSLATPPFTTIEDTTEQQLEQSDTNHSGLFYYNLLHAHRDMKDEQIPALERSRSAQKTEKLDAPVASDSGPNIENVLPERPLIVEKTINPHNQEGIKHDIQLYNPLRDPRHLKRLQKTMSTEKPMQRSSKPLFLNRLL